MTSSRGWGEGERAWMETNQEEREPGEGGGRQKQEDSDVEAPSTVPCHWSSVKSSFHPHP